MPDEDQLTFHPAAPSPSIKRSTSSLAEQIARLPARKDLARTALLISFTAAALVILWIEAFWRHCL